MPKSQKSFLAPKLYFWAIMGLMMAALVLGFFSPQAGLAQGAQSQAQDWAAADFKDGDILLQAVDTFQTLALTLATGSQYTHTGVVYWRDGQVFVYEALANVTLTPMAVFVARAKGDLLQYRLKDPSLITGQALAKMIEVGNVFDGKPYDFKFLWSDEQIYCSELVYKIYQRGLGLELVPLRPFKDYDLTHPVVKALIEKRFGQNPPLGELAVAPADFLNSPYLTLAGRIKGGQNP
ncbi:MAG: hypothetical protein LBT38_03565 [Deltaproteobacteria bacterium]|jgi:hypothetical protein|nr:hypothetical protein [Deltaproteobacteria bacterium]